jgi:hypothetical protein
VLSGRQQLHVATRVGGVSLVDGVIDGKVEVPELDVVLDSRAAGGQGDESALGCPCEGVGGLVLELTCDRSTRSHQLLGFIGSEHCVPDSRISLKSPFLGSR